MKLERSKRDSRPSSARGFVLPGNKGQVLCGGEDGGWDSTKEYLRSEPRRSGAGKNFGWVPGCRFPGHRPFCGEPTVRRSRVCSRFAVDAQGHAKGRTPRPRRCLQVSPAKEKISSRVRDAQKRKTRLWKLCTGKAADPRSGADNKCGLEPTHNGHWTSWGQQAVRGRVGSARSADEATLRKVPSTHARAERFKEGHFVEVFESGCMNAFVRRAGELQGETDRWRKPSSRG
jgi:hypothetical protein